MKFNRTVWRWDNLREITPRRIAAAKIAVKREAARVAAARDSVALFPELAAEIQPEFTSEEQRLDDASAREVRITSEVRSARAADWRKARSRLYSLPPIRRQGFLKFWSKGIYPFDPAYALTALDQMSKPGHSPWTYLRKTRLIVAWREGTVPKPFYFRLILNNDLNGLGFYRAARDPRRTAKIRKIVKQGIQLEL